MSRALTAARQMRRVARWPAPGTAVARLSATAVVAAAAVAPAAASAAPFGELPFTAVRGSAVCLSPTGAPGELVRWAPGGAELLDATPAGLVPRGTIRLGALRSCPVAATDAGRRGCRRRRPTCAGSSSRCATPASRGARPRRSPPKLAADVSVAVSARGDAVVAWAEYEPSSETAHVQVVRRPAGGAFGAPQRIEPPSKRPSLEVAMTADGAALLAIIDRQAVQLASAAPGAPFGAAAEARARRRRRLQLRVRAGGHARRPGAAGRGSPATASRSSIATPGGDFVQRPSLPVGGDALAVALATGRDGRRRLRR